MANSPPDPRFFYGHFSGLKNPLWFVGDEVKFSQKKKNQTETLQQKIHIYFRFLLCSHQHSRSLAFLVDYCNMHKSFCQPGLSRYCTVPSSSDDGVDQREDTDDGSHQTVVWAMRSLATTTCYNSASIHHQRP